MLDAFSCSGASQPAMVEDGDFFIIVPRCKRLCDVKPTELHHIEFLKALFDLLKFVKAVEDHNMMVLNLDATDICLVMDPFGAAIQRLDKVIYAATSDDENRLHEYTDLPKYSPNPV